MRKIFIDNKEVSYCVKSGSVYTLFRMKNGELKAVFTYEYDATIGKQENIFLVER